VVIAIDIDAFMEPEEYQERFARFESYLKGTRPMKGFERVMLPVNANMPWRSSDMPTVCLFCSLLSTTSNLI
jgi:LDH2 family malate/lactate/ureidoglycolate dehydrogenase